MPSFTRAALPPVLDRFLAEHAQVQVQVVEGYAQARVTHSETRKPLSAVYVKVYARMKDGQVKFYKDGYTDLRGIFDYGSLSTNELDFVDRFALLFLSDMVQLMMIILLVASGFVPASRFAWMVCILLAAALWLFASRLSRRVQRLGGAVSRAMADGAEPQALPLVRDRDELGELARNNERLLRAVAEYSAYLKTLASKLSHELKTPLAITRSSLDNLADRDLDRIPVHDDGDGHL